MGLFKSIKKTFKSIGSGIAKVFRKVGRAVKKAIASDAFKIIALVAIIATGGALAGLWNVPWITPVAGTALTSSTIAAGAPVVELGATTASIDAAVAAAGGAVVAPTSASVIAGAEAAGAAAGAGLAAPTTGAATGASVGELGSAAAEIDAAAAVAKTGEVIKAQSTWQKVLDAGKMTSKWMETNPIKTQLAGKAISALGSSMSAESVADAAREEAARIRERYNIAGIYADGGGTALDFPSIRAAQVADLYQSTTGAPQSLEQARAQGLVQMAMAPQQTTQTV